MSFTAAVITVSDKGYAGERVDTSGPMICGMLAASGFEVVHTAIVPDDAEKIKAELIRCADEKRVALVLTTGGTGFSPRDITPEATLAVVERETRGIPEAMRAESLKITPRGCLSRSAAGIRGRTLIVNLPGSEKAARENLEAVLPALEHGLDMLASNGSADCAEGHKHHKPHAPSADKWLREAKAAASANGVGMYLIHNGVVRGTSRAYVREGSTDARKVCGMELDHDEKKLAGAIAECERMEGISLVRVWINSGTLKTGDDIMYVLVGGETRQRVIAALEALVDKIKNECVTEREIFSE